MLSDMRAVFTALPEWIVEHRRITREDRRDEVWDGVLHVTPQPTMPHQDVGSQLLVCLLPLAQKRGWKAVYEPAVYDQSKGETNYRVPDVAVFDPKHASKRGIEGRCELAIEVLSPDDESREKLPFYAQHGTQELWLVDPETRAFEVYVLRGRAYFAIAPDDQGVVRAPMFELALQTLEGPKLVVSGRELRVEI
jgi:Uma2 family endonuclease